VDYYQKLGVTPFINAAGTYTVLSASTMPDEVQAAIALAAKKPVNLSELLDASGAYLAKQLHCEAALVTSARGRDGGVHHHGKRAGYSPHSYRHSWA
jgi:L-seryl-tRNA(Ser) seleniumtransferase